MGLLRKNKASPARLAARSGKRSPSASPPDRLQAFLFLQCKSVMNRNVVSVRPQTTLKELERLFEAHKYNAFPVVRAQRLVGLVSRFDFLKQFVFTTQSVIPRYEQLLKRRVDDIMTKEPLTVEPTTPLTRVLQLMVETRSRSFPVIDKKHRLMGMVARGDIVPRFRQ